MRSITVPLDLDLLKKQYREATPFPFFKVDGFLDADFAREVTESYPTYETARTMGREFQALNEKRKVQVTDSSRFPAPVQVLAEYLSGSEFLKQLEYVTGIPKLVSDPSFGGGGMHLSGTSGRLDVHVDFNYLGERNLFRRLNILLYLNPVWDDSWGGNIELWDREVKHCHHSFQPVFNRCVVFETSDISYHGVTPISCPPEYVRKSFAAYYYTVDPPENWDGKSHSTVFRPRPNEMLRGKVLMPAQEIKRGISEHVRGAKELVKKIIRD